MKQLYSLFSSLFFTLFVASSAFSLDDLGPGSWAAFVGLTGGRLGDVNPAVLTLKKYLHRFGYFHSDFDPKFTDMFDDGLELALRTYQQNYNLDVTGVLDLPTIKQLVSPRCGVADIINGTSSMSSGKDTSGRRLFEFFPGNPEWPRRKRRLTYAVTSTSAVSVDPPAIRAVFARAFARWAAVTTLSFVEVSSGSEADITIGFYRGDHGDGEAFDGVLQTLAHAFAPTDGRFHLDADEEWVADGDVTAVISETAVDLESVAVHEIGHLLGLGHSSEGEAIMFSSITTRTKKVDLARDDIEGVQRLYGSNPNYAGGGEIAPALPTGKQEMGENDGGVGLERGGVFEWILAGAVFLLNLCILD